MAPVVAESSLRQQVNACRTDLIAGKIDTEEYFGLVLSILGNETTFKVLPSAIEEIAVRKPQLHKSLSQLYETYFSEVYNTHQVQQLGPLTGADKLQGPACELDEELDLELAIQLSMKETGIGGSDIYESEDADNITYAAWGNDSPLTEEDLPQISTPFYQDPYQDSGRGRGRDNGPIESVLGEDFPQLSTTSQASERSRGPLDTGITAQNNSRRRRVAVQGAWGGADTGVMTNQTKDKSCRLYGGAQQNLFSSAPKFTFVGTTKETTPKTQANTSNIVPNNALSVYTHAQKQNIAQTKTLQTKVDRSIRTPSQNGQQQLQNMPKSAKGRNKRKNMGSVQRLLQNKPVIYWIRRDLRIYDNPALLEASMGDAPIIPIFLWSEIEEGPLAAGGATKLWIHHALNSLNETFKNHFQSQILFIKTNSCLRELQRLVRETNAGSIVWNDVYEPFLKHRDDTICKTFEKSGVSMKRHHSYLLYEPGCVNMESVGLRGLGSVTHFMEACRQSVIEPIAQPLDAPSVLPRPSQWPTSQSLSQLELAKMPKRRDGSIIDWAAPIVALWDFTENGAYEALQEFLAGAIRKYDKESGRSDQLNTCRISPYLHFGQISPRTVLHEAKHKKCNKFLRKLAWRDLSYFLLEMFPNMDKEPLRPHYKNQRWSNNRQHLKAWQQGRTGYPLVDAAMRQLWLEGWMNNYMRHVVASFLISYLHLHWIEGYRWFQDTLVDADVAINAMMWQNGGMSGMDHWNFVMHPVDAAMTCDPSCEYIRKWVPELSALPDEFVCKPWKCPPSILKRAGIELGLNYPERVITDLDEAREQSLCDAVNVRIHHGGRYVDKRTGNDLVPLSCGILLPVITRKEFKYKTSNPEAEDNPYSAVLHGYRSRKRDEAIAFANQVDFLSSTINECVQRSERSTKGVQFEKY